VNINDSNKDGLFPLLLAIRKRNADIVNIIIEYANQNNLVIDIKNRDNEGNFPLLEAIYDSSITIAKILFEYARVHNIVLEINNKNNSSINPLYKAVKYNKTDIVKMLIDYAEEHNIELNINDNSPIMTSFDNKCTEISKLIIDYSNQHHIELLNLNDTCYKYSVGITQIIKDNQEAFILILDYSTHHEFSIKIEENSFDKNYEYLVIEHDDIEKTVDQYKLNSKTTVALKKYFRLKKQNFNKINEDGTFTFFHI